MTQADVTTSAKPWLAALLAAASGWLIVACAVRTPLERALAHGALCGGHAFGGGEILSHCQACYAGLAAFALAMWALSLRTAHPSKS